LNYLELAYFDLAYGSQILKHKGLIRKFFSVKELARDNLLSSHPPLSWLSR
jgi:hypothetical protein